MPASWQLAGSQSARTCVLTCSVIQGKELICIKGGLSLSSALVSMGPWGIFAFFLPGGLRIHFLKVRDQLLPNGKTEMDQGEDTTPTTP